MSRTTKIKAGQVWAEGSYKWKILRVDKHGYYYRYILYAGIAEIDKKVEHFAPQETFYYNRRGLKLIRSGSTAELFEDLKNA